MKTALRIAFAGLFILSASLAYVQQDFSNVEIKAAHAAGAIHILEGRGGNIGVSVGEDGILIVDDQFAPLAEKIRAALKNINSGALKFVLNTHWHGDHTGGNPVFGKEATIIAHHNVRQRLMTEQKRGEQVTPPSPKEAWPVITLDASLSLHFNGEEIKVVHFPRGHTDGDCVIFFTGSNVVHMGDDFFAGRFPFVDLVSGGDVEGLVKNIENIIAQLPSDVKIIPGHGPLSTLDDLKNYHHMLVQTVGAVRQGIAANKSLEELKAQGLPEEWKSWAGNFVTTERWIETIYQSLTIKKS
jgi:glyoxylase-like metal-dependent hydrolase (beta-lactamase superfamily II)